MEQKKGLSRRQVEEKIAQGQQNTDCDVASVSYGEIVRRNVFTFFNGLNIMLACCVAAVHSYRNMLFLGVIFWNTLIGIVQEIRAKKELDRMAILMETTVTVWRDGKQVSIPHSEVVLGDWVVFHTGQQICADGEILEGCCQMDESMLTGESDSVQKNPGDKVLSGSYITSGQVVVKVTAVGKDSYANRLVLQAKQEKKEASEIRDSLDRLIKIVSAVVVPLGLLMFVKQKYQLQLSFQEAVVKTVASVLNLIPDGLVLLASMVMAVGVIRLSKKNAVVQGLYSIENLARVDVLCLDKTGTITEGTMELEEELVLDDSLAEEAIRAYLTAIQEDTATSLALRRKYGEPLFWNMESSLSFSSVRKWGAVKFAEQGMFVLGAPEQVLGAAFMQYEERLAGFLKQGRRVLVLARSVDGNIQEEQLGTTVPVAFYVMKDKIRLHARETLGYFQEQGVRLILISGDHPETVSQIGIRAGLQDAENYVDARTLQNEEEIAMAVKQYTVFGRVTPEQKREIVRALQKQGHTVAMTGDGVNDVLALKASDCSIVMDSGCDVARKTAKVVLEGSDFSVMPQILAEGRRAINNLERSASLFLTKTTFSSLLLFLFLVLQMSYPLQPIQMTLIGTLTIGVPAFLLALEPNYQVVRGRFLYNIFEKALPTGVIALCNVILVSLLCHVLGLSEETRSAMTTVAVASANFVLLFILCKPWKCWKGIMYVVLVAVFVIALLQGRSIFLFGEIPVMEWFLLLLLFLADAVGYLIYAGIHGTVKNWKKLK